MKYYLLVTGVAATVALAAMNVVVTHAHFIVSDESTGLGAEFHSTPDHSPIAGEESIISFDFAKTDTDASQYTFELDIKSTKRETVPISIDARTNVVLATYVFPVQGFYDIELKATHKDTNVVSTLRQGQRVSRGVSETKQSGFKQLEIALVAGAVIVAVGAIVLTVRNGTKTWST